MNLDFLFLEGLKLSSPNELYFILLSLGLSLISSIRGKRGIFSFFTRSLIFVSLILVIWPPKFNENFEEAESETLIALIDSSTSMSKAAIEACQTEIKKQSSDILFFSSNLNDSTEGESDALGTTNIEDSLLSLSKKVRNKKVLICSDGIETKGNALNAIPLLRENKIELIPVYPDARLLLSSGLKLSSLEVPIKVSQGQRIPLGFTLENLSDSNIKDDLEILIDSQKHSDFTDSVGSSSSKAFKRTLEPLAPGRHKISIVSKNSAQALHKWVLVEENLKPLILHSDEKESLLLRKIYPILGIKPEHILISSLNSLPSSLETYSTVVLNDIPANKLSGDFLNRLKTHVSSGKRLVILGGDSSFGLGKYQTSPINELSPLLPVPPRSKVERLPSAVMLVVDKSGSMAEQGKIMSARMAALSSIQSLKDEDYVGVIGFDSGPISIVELGKVKDVKGNARERLQGNLTAKGHTNLLPALSLARLRLENIKAGRKHIIVLSDGQIPQSRSDAFVQELNRIRKQHITISTVALGYEADVQFMKMVAEQGRGSFYQTLDPSRLPKLFVDDIKVAVGEDTISEQAEYDIEKGPSGLISTSTEVPPPLGGFIETKKREGANLELTTLKGEEKFPILASINVGNGRVIAFASDLQGRWSKTWLRWNELVRFVSDLTGTNSSGKGEGLSKESQFDFRYTVTGGVVKFELYIYDKSAIQGGRPVSLALTDKNRSPIKSLEFSPKEEGLYTTSTVIKNSGDYFLNGNIGTLEVKDIGLNINPKDLGEYQGGGINYDLLEELRIATRRSDGKILEKKASSNKEEGTEKYLDTRNLIYLCMLLLMVEVLVRERR